MNDKAAYALSLVQQALSHYTETPTEQMQPDAVLKDIGIDSLTLAELLFELEDRLNTTISEATEVPQQISDVIALILPYIDDNVVQRAA